MLTLRTKKIKKRKLKFGGNLITTEMKIDGLEKKNVRLNLINHVLALFHNKFACNTALRNPVFRWESCKGSV